MRIPQYEPGGKGRKWRIQHDFIFVSYFLSQQVSIHDKCAVGFLLPVAHRFLSMANLPSGYWRRRHTGFSRSFE